MSEGSFGFATEVQERVIKTADRLRSTQLKSSGYNKLKEAKLKAKQVEESFLEQVAARHRAQKSLEDATRKSLMKRVEFLKIYGNKKSKYQHRELLELQRREEEKVERESIEIVKRRKLERELHHLLLQNEEEEHVYRLQSKNKQEKQVLRRHKQIAQQREQSVRRHDAVRKGNTEFLIRKKNMQTSISMRSRHNYYTKIAQELTLIKQYEDIMNEINHYATLDSKDDSTLFQTVDLTPTAYVTSPK